MWNKIKKNTLQIYMCKKWLQLVFCIKIIHYILSSLSFAYKNEFVHLFDLIHFYGKLIIHIYCSHFLQSWIRIVSSDKPFH